MPAAPWPPQGNRALARSFPCFFRSVFLILLLVQGGSVSGAVRFDMFVGYDGLVPHGSWFPVTFEVQNDGPSFVGTVQVIPGQFNAGYERSTTVELPTGTTKRFTIPVFSTAAWNPNWKAKLVDERGRLRAEAEGQNLRRFNATILPVVASMTRHSPALPEGKSRQENMRAVFGRMPSAVFPENPIVLDGLDALYLSSEKALELKVNQVTALLGWLHGGGHLIISVEQPNHLDGPGEWLRRILPADVMGLTTAAGTWQEALQRWVSGPQRVDGRNYDFSGSSQTRPAGPAGPALNPFAQLSEDPAFTGVAMQLAHVRLRDGRVLAGSVAQPLVIISRRGLGQLTLLTFAPELEPFRGWKNAPYFWAKMVGLPPEVLSTDYPNRAPGRSMDGIFGAMLDSRQIRKLPVGWLLLLLIAYLVVIGPLDQYWLKKLNRQMLTWLTFPAYVTFFSLLIYFIGYKLRAGETEWSELHVLDVIPHGAAADVRARSFSSIYSPVNARYVLDNEMATATLRGEFASNYGRDDSTRGEVEQRPAGFRASISVPVWTSQLFVSDWWQQSSPPPVALFVGQDEIRVDNRLDQTLRAVRVVIEREVLILGDVAAGATRTFRRRDLRSSSLDSFVPTVATSFAAVVNARQRVFADNREGRIDDWTNAVVAASFLSALRETTPYESFRAPRGFELSPAVAGGQAVLLGWAPGYSMLKPVNQFTARRQRRDTVFRVLGHVEK